MAIELVVKSHIRVLDGISTTIKVIYLVCC